VPHKTVINDVGASWNDTRETLFLFTFLGAAEATCGDISRGKKSRVVETRPGRKKELRDMLGILDSLKPPPPFLHFDESSGKHDASHKVFHDVVMM
jgi:hypothetical protein